MIFDLYPYFLLLLMWEWRKCQLAKSPLDMTWAISFGISFMGHTQYITFTAYGWQFLDFSGEVLQNYRNCLIISLSRALYSLATKKKEKKERALYSFTRHYCWSYDKNHTASQWFLSSKLLFSDKYSHILTYWQIFLSN